MIKESISSTCNFLLETLNFSSFRAFYLARTFRGDEIIDNLETFKGVNHHRLARSLILLGFGAEVASELDRFKNVDVDELAQCIFHSGRSGIRSGSTHEHSNGEVVHYEENAGTLQLLSHLHKAKRLNEKDAVYLIRAGHGEFVVENIDLFSVTNRHTVSEKLRQYKYYTCLANNIEKFLPRDGDLAVEIILNAKLELDPRSCAVAVCSNIHKFSDPDPRLIANALIEAELGDVLVEFIDTFNSLPQTQLVSDLIAAKQGGVILSNLNKFPGISQSDIALKFIDHGQMFPFKEPFGFIGFTNLDDRVARKLIETGHTIEVSRNLSKFVELRSDVLNRLIEAKQGEAVIENLGAFVPLDHTALAQQLDSAEQLTPCILHIDRFDPSAHNTIAECALSRGAGTLVVRRLDRFQGLKRGVLERLLNHARAHEPTSIDSIVKRINSF